MNKIFAKSFIYFIFTAVNLYSQTAILPVELTFFKYNLIDSTVYLSWGTATETDNYGFNVERFSDSSWNTIKFVEGANVSNSPKTYYYADTTAFTGKTYLYRLLQIDLVGGFEYSDTLTVVINPATGIKEKLNDLLDTFQLNQNYPNPFNPVTIISWRQPVNGRINLSVYNVQGKRIAELIHRDVSAGIHKFKFESGSLPSGIYFYKLVFNGQNLVKKMILQK